MTRLPIVPSRLSDGSPGFAAPSHASPASELYLVARVGTERFAFPVAQVDMVVDAPPLSWVPGAPDGLLGQMRHRDRTVRAYAAGWALGVPPVADADPRSGTALILRAGELRVAVVVDDAEDLQMVPAETVRPVPVGADPEGVLRGVCCALGRGRDVVGLVRVEALVAHVTADAALASVSAR